MNNYYILEDFNNQDDVFEKFDFLLSKDKLVKDKFLEAIKKREKSFPTGLNIKELVDEGYNAAIPHVDMEYCNQDALIFLFSKKPILWKDMVFKEEIEVNFIIAIISSKGEEHMKILPTVINLLKDQKFQKQLNEIDNIKKFEMLIKKYFRR